VKLIEADELPRLIEFGAGIGVSGVKVLCERGEELGVVQEKFALAIGALVAGLRGVGAAMIFEIEFAVGVKSGVKSRL